ncbi:unnamed protein product [Adineta steineri]|uniref:Cation-transporting P-type ATPase N-terminal domain-containing protein n=1 Tax=Adineta steineri TaxID=433720 RepID=A0A813NAZ3_9BILA|nr:unnamed protein product [Adineta steineri]CAF3966802.1 unnamed protein product [Adineta steineri]
MDNQALEIDEPQERTTIPTRIARVTRQDSTVSLWATVDKSRLNQDVHIIPLEEVFSRYHTDPRSGLTSDHVQDARAQYGDNKLTPPKQPSYTLLLLKELFMGFNIILWFAGILAFLAYKPFGEPAPSISNLALGVVLILVITCNSILNVYQQLKSIKIVSAFSKLLPTLATVRRDGREQQIITNEIVPGDIILVRMGDKLPADCRFISCDGLKVNTSELTGESKPVSITVRCSSETFMESTNMGFYSTMVEQGTGEAVVVATGDSTVLGKMSKLTRGSSGDDITGLHREVNRFVLFVCACTLIGIVILWITWAAWLNQDHHTFLSYDANIVNSIGMIVGFLPVGLPSAVTLVLTIVAKQMYRQRVLVKSLQIVETFNSVSVIATDKTGTLTQNKMTITHLLWDTDGIYKVPLPKQEPSQEETVLQRIRRLSTDVIETARRLSISTATMIRKLSSASINQPQDITSLNDDNGKNNIPDKASEVKIEAFRDLLLGAALCNNAEKQMVQDSQIGQDISKMKSELSVVGDAADTALYNLCVDRCYVDIDKVHKVNPRLKALPFNSTNKFMITANQLETLDSSLSDKNRIILLTLKGALDIVIQRCSTYKMNDDNIATLDNNMKKTLFDRQEELGKNGYRVIAMCQQRFTRQEYDDMMENYKNKKRSSSSQEGEDLNGFPPNDYCFIGLFSLLDPPRPEVPGAVIKARRAQIRVAMVTGDHPTTARAIAKQVNILTPEIADMNGVDTFKLEKDANGKSILNLYRNDKLIEQHEPGTVKRTDSLSKNTKDMVRRASIASGELVPEILPWYKRAWLSIRRQFSEPETDVEPTQKMAYIPYGIVVAGAEINYMDDFMWDWVLSHQELVFARTSPEQKLRIVIEFQRRAEIVAVTGDGTNDAPALKCANLGVAMQSGTEVSKEAGDMILLDNNFASIIQAIETGRLLSDNLKKVSVYLLPGGSWSQIWPVFFNLWFGMPLALTAFLATVFCMINDVFMSLAMVTEKPERDIMSRPPVIRSKDHLLNWKLLLHAYMFVGNLECFTGFFCFCYYWIDMGVPFYSFMFTFESFGNDITLYSQDQLTAMTGSAQCVYYCSVCLFQFFNYFATRTRYTSIIEHNPLWGKGQNLYVFGAMIISAGIQVLITQVAWFNTVFGTGSFPVKYVMPALGFGMLWLIIDELRKLCIRKFPRGFIAKIAW